MVNSFTHIDKSGRLTMVDVSAKPVQIRLAEAEGFIQLKPDTIEHVKKALLKKGDVLTAGELAGIQAAKRTSELIPLCHPLILDQINVRTEVQESSIRVVASVKCTGRTGAEMEALTAVGIALLTLYDMCKAIDKSMTITQIRLLHKEKIS